MPVWGGLLVKNHGRRESRDAESKRRERCREQSKGKGNDWFLCL